MTDNTKMREAVAAAKKIVASPNGYTETSVLVAKALLEQAAKSVPVVGEQVEKERDEANARLHDVSVACATAEQERDELRKDAERYRWLRDGNDNKKSAACHIAVNCYGLEWDDAIDAAIAQGKGE